MASSSITIQSTDHREYILPLPLDDGIAAEFPSLLQFIIHTLPSSNRHPVLATAESTDPFLEEEGDILLTTIVNSTIDMIDENTGDFEDVPAIVDEPRTEYDYIIEKSLLVLSKLMLLPSISESSIDGLYSMVMNSFQSVLAVLGKGDDDERMSDYSVMMKMVSYLNFQQRNIEVLVILSQIIK